MNIFPIRGSYFQNFAPNTQTNVEKRDVESKDYNHFSYSCEKANDGSLIIRQREHIASDFAIEMNRNFFFDYDYCIKPDGTIYRTHVDKYQPTYTKDITIYKADNETQQLISKLQSQMGKTSHNKELIASIVNSISNGKQYDIKMTQGSSSSTTLILSENTPSSKDRDSEFVSATHTFTLDTSFKDAPPLASYTFSNSRIYNNTSQRYTIETGKLPENVKEDLGSFIKSVREDSLSFEDIENFMQQDVMPVKKQLEFI